MAAKIETNGKIGPHVKVKDQCGDGYITIRKHYADPSKRHIMVMIGDRSLIVAVKDLIDAAHAFGVYQDSLEQRLKDRAESDPIYQEACDEIVLLKRQIETMRG